MTPNLTRSMPENDAPKPPAVILRHRSAPAPELKPFVDAREQAVLPAAHPDIPAEPSVGRIHFGYDSLTEAQFDNLQICEDLNGMMDAYGLDRIVRLFATVCQGRGVTLSQYLAREVK